MSTTINLGNVDSVRILYSYPNNFNEVGFLEQSLEETICAWFRNTLKRDGLSAAIQVAIENGDVSLILSGDGEDLYGDAVNNYLRAGMLALKSSIALNAKGRWLYNWRFVLPHGLAMINHRSVQLLHFPPDYVLERDQDYLLAHTTTRWAQLLVENGVAEDDTYKYQTIVDIAPIAAPSNAGQSLEGVYSFYTDYINDLLGLWIPTRDGNNRPMVAFGSPVRTWLKSEYGIDLPVLKTGNFELQNGLRVSILGANHPSFIYNAAKSQPTEPQQSEEQLVRRSMRIMQQDLIAAGWQVRMAESPSGDPQAALIESTNQWTAPSMLQRICELTYEQAFNKSAGEAEKICSVFPTAKLGQAILSKKFLSLDNDIDILRESLGALDGQEPDLSTSSSYSDTKLILATSS